MPPTRDYSRFDRFLDRIGNEVYPEEPREPHVSITKRKIEAMHKEELFKAGDRILDVGCGQGFAMELFSELGAVVIGISLGSDVAVCRAKGLNVLAMDQNFMTFDDGSFDLLWCRHVLEHSVAPLFTLSEYQRVTKRGGLIYVEVPAPDTSARHERGANHYSLLPKSAWMNLFARVGLFVEHRHDIDFEVSLGPDKYWAFHLRNLAP